MSRPLKQGEPMNRKREIALTKSMNDSLERASRQTGASVNELIRRAIEQAYALPEPLTLQEHINQTYAARNAKLLQAR